MEYNRILTLDEMRRRRHAIDFCYLCGKDLSEPTQEEHVVPRAVLRLIDVGPELESSKWPVLLDVHADCEKKHKAAEDNWLAPLHKMHSQPPPSNARASDHMPKTVSLGMIGNLPVLYGPGINDYCEGVWTWIRGLHTAIYGEFLSKRCRKLVLLPALAWSENGGPNQEETENMSGIIRIVTGSAMQRGVWDGITVWGDKVQYRCVWRFIVDKWVCFWELDGLPYQVMGDLFDGSIPERPWHGYYYSTCPKDASKSEGDMRLPPNFTLIYRTTTDT